MSNIAMAHDIIEAKNLIDTIATPPENPVYVMGPETSCVGATSVYTSDIPLGCDVNWYVNGVLQTSAFDTLEIIWTSNGDNYIELEFECDTITFIADSLFVVVSDIPNQPDPIQGDDIVCIGTTSPYSTNVGSGELCQWKVDDIVQLSDSAVMSYYWNGLGTHIIEVRALNYCGLSNPAFFEVVVQELPIVDLGDDITIYEGNSIILYAGNPGCTYLWSTGDTTQSIVVSQSGNYEVVVSNICGAVSDDINVNVIVGIEEEEYSHITVYNKGDYVDIEIDGEEIHQVSVSDLRGRVIGIYRGANHLFLPRKGIFFAKITTAQNSVIKCKIVR